MVFLPGRLPLRDESMLDVCALSRNAQVIVDLLDVVSNVRDGDHLQCIAFLAQEVGLLAEPHLLFGAVGPVPRRPHSLLLESHLQALLGDGVIDLGGAGHLRLRRDLYDLPFAGLVSRRVSVLGALSPSEAAIFAAAVLCLAQDGRYAGSRRHDAAFHDAATALANRHENGSSIDIEAICATRQRLMFAEPVLLTPV